MVYLLLPRNNGMVELCRANNLRWAEMPGQLIAELRKLSGGEGYFIPPAFVRVQHKVLVDLLPNLPTGVDPGQSIYLDNRNTSLASPVTVDWGGEARRVILVRHGRILSKTKGGFVETIVSRPRLNNAGEYEVAKRLVSHKSTDKMAPWVAGLAESFQAEKKPGQTGRKELTREEKVAQKAKRAAKQARLDQAGKASKGRGASAGKKVKPYKKGQSI